MRRPIILLSITAFLQTLFILVFPNMFPIAISLMILLLTFFVILFIGKRKYILIIPTALILIFASLNPYFAYLKNEKKAQDFALSLSDSKDVEYSATVTECNVYSSYSQIFANLTKVGQNELDKSYRIRITSFNKTPLEKGDKILDLGCGSGILSIAAALCGSKNIKGVDIDPNAVEASFENVEKNGMSDVIEISWGDVTQGLGFKADIIVANLMADLIMMLSDDIAKHLKGKKIFISSGILVEKRDQVAEVIRNSGFEIIEILEEDEWCAIAARLK